MSYEDIPLNRFAWGYVVPINSPTKDRPKDQFISYGPWLLQPKLMHSLPAELDGLASVFTPRVWDAMMNDATVKSAVISLMLGILDGGISLSATHPMPALVAKASAGKPPVAEDDEGGEEDGSDSEEVDEPASSTPGTGKAPTDDQLNSKKALDACQRTLDRLGEDLEPQLFSLLHAMIFGVKLAEITCTVPKEGEDAGKLVISEFRVRPNRCWRFMVDAWGNVRCILTWDVATGCYVLVDKSKFAWLTWMPVDSDPRGTSMLRAAYEAWNLKIQTWPQLYAHNARFGSPGIDIEMAEGDNEERQPLDADGNEIPDADPVTSTQYVIMGAKCYQNGGILAHPNGSKVSAFESKSDGSALRQAIALLDQQICMAIELQAESAKETTSADKSHGRVGQDTKGLVNSYGRTALAGVVRKMLRDNLRDNEGDEFASRYTPIVKFGGQDQQDRPTMISAMGSVGYAISPSMLPEIDAELGLPVRDPEEDMQHAQAAMEMQAKFAPKPPGGDTGKASGEKPAKSSSKGASE